MDMLHVCRHTQLGPAHDGKVALGQGSVTVRLNRQAFKDTYHLGLLLCRK